MFGPTCFIFFIHIRGDLCLNTFKSPIKDASYILPLMCVFKLPPGAFLLFIVHHGGHAVAHAGILAFIKRAPGCIYMVLFQCVVSATPTDC